MELEDSLDKITESGLGVVAISYDSVEIIRHFSERMGGFRYSLLADSESEIIDAFGLRNTHVEKGHPWYGIAFPGTYIVDANGVVTEKFFSESYRQRITADTILIESIDADGKARIEASTPQFNLVAYASESRVYPGNHFGVAVEIELPEKMHLYAPGSKTYRGVELRLTENPMLMAGDMTLPEAETLFLPVIDEAVPVYTDKVRLFRRLTLSPRYQDSSIEVNAVLAYQTCDDEICFPPAELPLVFNLDVIQNDDVRVPEPLRRIN